MAQHCKLEPIVEPVIFMEVKNLGSTIYRVLGKNYFVPFQKMSGVGKTIMLLSDDYKMEEDDDSAFKIGKFTLQDKSWHEENSHLVTNTDLECHFDKYGNVTAIYLVV